MEKFTHFMLGFLVAIIAWQFKSMIVHGIADVFGITDFYLQSFIVIGVIGGVALGIHLLARKWV